MKKQLIIFGIILILLTVGLSGCNKQSPIETSICDILNHPKNYINHTVTVKANSIVFPGTNIYHILTPGCVLETNESSNIEKPSSFTYGTEYKFTGIIKYGWTIKSNFYGRVYIEITKIEPIYK